MKSEGITETQAAIYDECSKLQDMLLQKNRRYGDSALNPMRIFSSASPIEQIRVRIDDKLSRIVSSQLDDIEDVILDLVGYLILLRIAEAKAEQAAQAALKEEVLSLSV